MRNQALCILIVLCLLFALIDGKIFSSKQFSKRGFVEKRSNEFSSELQNIRHKRSLQQGDPPSGYSEVRELAATQFDLKNGTSHNQALIHWSGNNSKVIFVLTRKKESVYMGKITHSTLWRSIDYGETYKQQNSKFDEDTVLKSYFICPTDKQKAVFIDNHRQSTRIWITTDEGDSYTSYQIDFSVYKIEFHPTISDWLLGYSGLEETLWVSQNLGKNWTKLHAHVTKDRYFWGVTNVEGGERAESIVHFEYRDYSVIPQRRYAAKSCYVPQCEPTPFQTHYDKLGRIDKESLYVQDHYIFVQKPGALQKFYVSYKRASFVKSKFAETSVEQNAFHIVSSDTGTVVVGVSHDDKACHLYFSDEKGENFILSKANVRYFPRKVEDDVSVSMDIQPIQGVKGTFIINVITPEGYNVTEISWDNGRTWSALSRPTNIDGDLADMCPSCTLNLHILMTQTPTRYYAPSLLSKESVPGLIIAHGSVGQTVEDTPSLFSVYVSRDAGVSWYKVMKKRHLFNLADHGAMIVGVQMMFLHPVKKLVFSNDFGASWTSHTFSKETINVDGLLTEPGEYTHHFTLFGHKSFNDNWKLYALDFSSLVSRNCSYPDDYENYTMPMRADSNCTLGMKQTVELLNKEAKCLVGHEYKRFVQVEKCPCRLVDYECDINYIQSGNICMKLSDVPGKIDMVGDYGYDVTNAPLPPCVNGFRLVPSGFRKVPGDVCFNDLNVTKPRNESCGDVSTPQTPHAFDMTLVNSSDSAAVGDRLFFVVKRSQVEWRVQKELDYSMDNYRVNKVTKEEVSFTTDRPGYYLVQASLMPHKKVSKTIRVSFWYPIERLSLFNPSVANVNSDFEIFSLISIEDGLRGTPRTVGTIEFVWETLNQQKTTNSSMVSRRDVIGDYIIQAAVQSSLNQVVGFGHIRITECVQTVLMETDLLAINDSLITYTWITEFTFLVYNKIRRMMLLDETVRNVMDSINFNTVNMEVFIPPKHPFTPQLIFIPNVGEQIRPNCEDVKLLASKTSALLQASPYSLRITQDGLSTSMTINVYTPEQPSHSNAGMIVLIVLIVIAVVVIAVVLYTRYSSRLNCASPIYFRVSNITRNGTSARSHIVRSRTEDQNPIVDEDEFMDDELDTMESIRGHCDVIKSVY